MFILVLGGTASSETTIYDEEVEGRAIELKEVVLYCKGGTLKVKRGDGDWIPTKGGSAEVPVRLDLTKLKREDRIIGVGEKLRIVVTPSNGTCEYTVAITGDYVG